MTESTSAGRKACLHLISGLCVCLCVFSRAEIDIWSYRWCTTVCITSVLLSLFLFVCLAFIPDAVEAWQYLNQAASAASESIHEGVRFSQGFKLVIYRIREKERNVLFVCAYLQEDLCKDTDLVYYHDCTKCNKMVPFVQPTVQVLYISKTWVSTQHHHKHFSGL